MQTICDTYTDLVCGHYTQGSHNSRLSPGFVQVKMAILQVLEWTILAPKDAKGFLKLQEHKTWNKVSI